MKITKHGTPKEQFEITYKLTCSNCGCEFIFDIHDIAWKEKTPGGNCGINCPDCGKEITFKREDCVYTKTVKKPEGFADKIKGAISTGISSIKNGIKRNKSEEADETIILNEESEEKTEKDE